jgi:two-component system, NarL family, nitrate/nitrite response regulator NarL
MAAIRILIVEDHAPWAAYIQSLISLEPSLQLLDIASDGKEGLRKAAELKPDVVLLDMNLPAMHGIDVARELKRSAHNARVLFVSMDPTPEIIKEAIAEGAGGYVLKTDASEIVQAILVALAGGVFLSTSLRSLPL